MSEHNFKELYESAINGDEEAIEQIIDTFQPIIYKNSYINGELDKGCIQELNIKLYLCIKKFKFKSKKELKEYLSSLQLY